jgi:hypothetical protein
VATAKEGTGGTIGRALVLTLKNEAPIAADDLGALLSALARDYRRLTRRTLVVERLETGSVVATLMDAAILVTPYAANAVEVAKAVNAIVDFAKLLRKRFVSEKSGKSIDAAEQGGPPALGGDSVKQLTKIVAKSGGEATFKYSRPGHESIEGKITSKEAIKIRERERTARAALRLTKQAELLALTHGDDDSGPVVKRLAGISGATELDEAIRALVAALRSAGLNSFLEMIASDLAAHGHSRIADLLRAEVMRSQRERAPPIERT